MFLKILFFVSVFVPFYVYLGYPAFLAILTTLRRRPIKKGDAKPSVTVIIPAHNEEDIIGAKIRNTLSLDYPKELLEVIVVSDGSDDRTEEIVRHSGDRVQLIPLKRCGKIRALNQAVPYAKGEVIVFTDANAMVAPDALRQLVSSFADAEVGCVCGNQKYVSEEKGDSSKQGEGLYWRYDKWIKQMETKIGSAVAADGSIYAIRANLFVEIEDPAQVDDHAISVRVILQGYRLVFEPDAVSYEKPPISIEQEFRRKVRNTIITARAVLNLAQTMNPFRFRFYAIEVLSHKTLRYMVPFFLLLALVTNILLFSKSRFYQVTLVGQVWFYGSALLGYLLRRSRWGQSKWFWPPLYFCLANVAAFAGIVSLLAGKRIAMWQPQRGTR